MNSNQYDPMKKGKSLKFIDIYHGGKLLAVQGILLPLRRKHKKVINDQNEIDTMGKFIDPFTDWGFKRIFGQEVKKERGG